MDVGNIIYFLIIGFNLYNYYLKVHLEYTFPVSLVFIYSVHYLYSLSSLILFLHYIYIYHI